MALTIYNNIAALGAQRALTTANDAQTKVIQRLSTGLRINNASDDASGLAISEKLRGQISGMKRASMNAQDGISYLQTAEGAMETVTSILQRLRELSVQAGNGVYTTNDRAMLQLEVDQLKSEINRIAQTSEFNTKKLLDGSGTALWSSSNNFVGAIVKGPSVVPGDYYIQTDMIPGTNSEYKSNILSVNEGTLVADALPLASNTTNMQYVIDPTNVPTTGNVPLDVAITATSGGNTTADVNAHTLSSASTLTNQFRSSASNWSVTAASISSGASAWSASTTQYSGYYELEFLESSPSMTSAVTFRYRLIDTNTNPPVPTNWYSGTTTVGGAGTANVTMKLDSNSGTLTLEFGPVGAVTKGDKILGSFEKTLAPEANASALITLSGGGTIRVSQDVNGVTVNGPLMIYSAAGSLTKLDNQDGLPNFNDIKFATASIDQKTGVVYYGSMTFQFLEQDKDTAAGTITPGVGVTKAGALTVDIRDSGVAGKDTFLTNIKGFTTPDGVNILENTQELKIYGNNTSTSIYIAANDTVETLQTKLRNAIVTDLGMGATYPISNVSTVDYNLVNFVGNGYETTGTNEAIPGTMILQTAMLGKNSNVTFIADQNLINALGFAAMQEGTNSIMNVKVTDATTGTFIGQDRVTDGKLRSIVAGVEVTLQQNAGMDVVWNTGSRTLDFTQNVAQSGGYLHLVDNRTELQIGANQGQTLNISIGRLDTTGLDIEDVYVMNMDLAQRSITKIDNALNQLNAARATIGAQSNRLQYTINNLSVASENLTASEARIRDLDMATETTQLSKDQILVQAATAMLAQANALPQQVLTLLRG